MGFLGGDREYLNIYFLMIKFLIFGVIRLILVLEPWLRGQNDNLRANINKCFKIIIFLFLLSINCLYYLVYL